MDQAFHVGHSAAVLLGILVLAGVYVLLVRHLQQATKDHLWRRLKEDVLDCPAGTEWHYDNLRHHTLALTSVEFLVRMENELIIPGYVQRVFRVELEGLPPLNVYKFLDIPQEYEGRTVTPDHITLYYRRL